MGTERERQRQRASEKRQKSVWSSFSFFIWCPLSQCLVECKVLEPVLSRLLGCVFGEMENTDHKTQGTPGEDAMESANEMKMLVGSGAGGAKNSSALQVALFLV